MCLVKHTQKWKFNRMTFLIIKQTILKHLSYLLMTQFCAIPNTIINTTIFGENNVIECGLLFFNFAFIFCKMAT